MKCVFLDFDGVLVNRASFQPPLKKPGVRVGGNPDCVAELNRITNATGAVLVVSSTWRIEGAMRCWEYLREWGVTGAVFDITPRLQTFKGNICVSAPRGREIQVWLDAQAGDVESFVILDDDADMEHLSPHLVQTAFEVGLTRLDADKAIQLLLQ
jgi:hypothetical protein